MTFGVIINYGYVNMHVTYFKASNKAAAVRKIKRDKRAAYLPSLRRVGFKNLPQHVQEALES